MLNSVLLVMMCVAISVQRNEEHETRVAWARSHGEKTSAVTKKERCWRYTCTVIHLLISAFILLFFIPVFTRVRFLS